MRKFLGQKWQNRNFEDKTILKNLFLLDFSLHVMHQTKNSIKKKFNFFADERFLCQFENLQSFEN